MTARLLWLVLKLRTEPLRCLNSECVFGFTFTTNLPVTATQNTTDQSQTTAWLGYTRDTTSVCPCPGASKIGGKTGYIINYKCRHVGLIRVVVHDCVSREGENKLSNGGPIHIHNESSRIRCATFSDNDRTACNVEALSRDAKSSRCDVTQEVRKPCTIV